jgi:2-dehydropantoate 2-reductase
VLYRFDEVRDEGLEPGNVMRICVFGAGAVGGHLAAKLAAAGHAVSVVVRGVALQAIRTSGLRLRIGDREIAGPVTATDDPDDLGPQDAVIVTVKATALAAVAERIGPLIAPATAVVFAQNGVPWWYPHGLAAAHRRPPALPGFDVGAAFFSRMALDQVIGGVIHSSNEVLEPGLVKCSSVASNSLTIGRVDGGNSVRLAELRSALDGAGMTSPATDDIRLAVWKKLMINLAGSSLSLLTGQMTSAVALDPDLARLWERLMEEGFAIAAAYGYDVRQDLAREAARRVGHHHKPSLLQDYERGRPMEVVEMITAPAALAKAAGVETPTLDVIAPLCDYLAGHPRR